MAGEKYKIIEPNAFDNLVKIIVDILSRDKTPKVPEVIEDLKLLGISPKSAPNGRVSDSVSRLKNERRKQQVDKAREERMAKFAEEQKLKNAAERARQEQIVAASLEEQKRLRPDDRTVYGHSPMSNLGEKGGSNKSSTPKKISDDDTCWNG
jgi:hypothetical protein